LLASNIYGQSIINLLKSNPYMDIEVHVFKPKDCQDSITVFAIRPELQDSIMPYKIKGNSYFFKLLKHDWFFVISSEGYEDDIKHFVPGGGSSLDFGQTIITYTRETPKRKMTEEERKSELVRRLKEMLPKIDMNKAKRIL